MSSGIRARDIIRKVGETRPIRLYVNFPKDEPLPPLTGASYRLVVDPAPSPDTNTNHIMDADGTLVSHVGSTIVVEFLIPTTAAYRNAPPKTYYFECEMTTAEGHIIRLGKNEFKLQRGMPVRP